MTKCCAALKQIIDNAGVNHVPLLPCSPQLHAFAERGVRSVQEEALSRMLLFGECALWHVRNAYLLHSHQERPPQGQGNVLL
jgi:hypothetical protein